MFSATTVWMAHLYINAHVLAFHRLNSDSNHRLQPGLLNHAQLLSNARVVTTLIAVILALVALRVGPRWMAMSSLIVGVLVWLLFATFMLL